MFECCIAKPHYVNKWQLAYEILIKTLKMFLESESDYKDQFLMNTLYQEALKPTKMNSTK